MQQVSKQQLAKLQAAEGKSNPQDVVSTIYYTAINIMQSRRNLKAALAGRIKTSKLERYIKAANGVYLKPSMQRALKLARSILADIKPVS